MDCVVCGKEFGLWARMTGDSNDAVCRACEKEGRDYLTRLRESISPSASLFAMREAFNSGAVRYRIPEKDLAPLRSGFCEALIVAASESPELNDALVEGVVNPAIREGGFSNVSAGTIVAQAACKINARQRISAWEKGDPPERECDGLLLQPGEVCQWEEPARLLEQRTRREYIGGYGGVSVRVMRGVRFHAGGFKGRPIDTTFLADCGMGWLHITDRRVCFTGGVQAISIDLKKLISVTAFEDGFAIFRTGAKKPTVFQVPFPELTLQLLGMATPAPND